MTTESSSNSPTIFEVFDFLRRKTNLAKSEEMPLYAAEAKKGLLREFTNFSERDYGFKRFIDLLEAGQSAGNFRIEKTNEGHPFLLPRKSSEQSPSAVKSRLRSELWTAMISWDQAIRYWDRVNSRAIFIPLGEDKRPLWESSPVDFVKIDEISMADHISWMHEFAQAQNDPVRTSLLAALDDEAPGAFKRALSHNSLQRAWTTCLQRKVMEHAIAWAANNGISPNLITENTQTMDDKGRSARTSTRPARHHKISADLPGSFEQQLRARLHQIIDNMSASELSYISIPATYLLTP